MLRRRSASPFFADSTRRGGGTARTLGPFSGPARESWRQAVVRNAAPVRRPLPVRLSVLAFGFAGLTALGAVLALSACQDATGVGLGLIGGDTVDPAAVVLPASALDTTEVSYPTAGFAGTTGTLPQARVLVGRVQDARFGDAVATAYVDAARPASVPEGFDGARVTSVTLELRRDYLYGDTTATLPVEVRLVAGNWTPDALPVDTTLGTGDLLVTAQLVATDTLATVTIPGSAFAGRDTLFSSPQFSSLFEGFELRVAETGAPAPGVVAGFNVATAASRLRVATATDTVSFALAEVYTRLEQTAPTMAPADLLPLRAGAPLGALRATFDPDTLGSAALARVLLSIPALPSADEGTFRRPVARELAVFGLPETGGSAFLAVVRRATAGDLRSAPTAGFTALVQNWLLGRSTFERTLELRFATSPISLDVLPLAPLPGGSDAAPRLIVSLVDPS